MGEIADMMLDGTLCEGCGELMDGLVNDTDELDEAPGHPRRCAACEEED